MKDYSSILKYAMQMELDGYNFFKEKSSKFNNPTSRKMFEDLAEVEMDHYNYLKDQLESYEETKSFKEASLEMQDKQKSIFENREDSEKISASLEASDIPDLTILRMAYLIERDYAEFYTDMAEKAEDEDAKKVFKTLAQWEKGHESLFKDEYQRRMKEYMNLPWGG